MQKGVKSECGFSSLISTTATCRPPTWHTTLSLHDLESTRQAAPITSSFLSWNMTESMLPNAGGCQTATVLCLRYHQGQGSSDITGLTEDRDPAAHTRQNLVQENTAPSIIRIDVRWIYSDDACGVSAPNRRNQSKCRERWRGPVVVVLLSFLSSLSLSILGVFFLLSRLVLFQQRHASRSYSGTLLLHLGAARLQSATVGQVLGWISDNILAD